MIKANTKPPAPRWKKYERGQYIALCKAIIADCNALMRKYGGGASLRQLRLYAHSRGSAHAIKMGLIPYADQMNYIVDRLCRTVKNNFDPNFGRQPPKSDRADKQARNAEIVRRYFSQNPAPSIRALAKEFGVADMTVQRTLRAAGVQPARQKQMSQLSTPGKRLVGCIDVALPNDCKRLVGARDLCRYAWPEGFGHDFDALNDIIAEVNARPLNIQIMMTDSPAAPDSMPWLVVSRGRKSTKAELLEWARKLEQERLDRRGINRVCQLHYLLPGHAVPLRDPVMRDLASVLHVMMGTPDLLQWRTFLMATAALGGNSELVIKDHGALLTALNGLFRLQNHDVVNLERVVPWIRSRPDRDAINRVFDLCSSLAEMSTADEALSRWLAVSQYRHRIQEGNLPTRSLHSLDARLRTIDSEATPEEVLRCFSDADTDADYAGYDDDDLEPVIFGSGNVDSPGSDRQQEADDRFHTDAEPDWDDDFSDAMHDDIYGYIMPPDDD